MTLIPFNIEIHKRRLVAILFDIAKSYNRFLVFKGGTAAMLFYGLPRASLTLDFDLIDKLSSDQWEELKLLARKHGTLKRFYETGFNVIMVIKYDEFMPNVKIQFNKRVWENGRSVIERLMGVSMLIADRTTMLTNKMIAITDRKTPVARDLFDVHFFLGSGFRISEALIKERTGMNEKKFLTNLIKFIRQNYSNKNILHGTGDLLDEEQKKWAKEHLIRETISEMEKISL